MWGGEPRQSLYANKPLSSHSFSSFVVIGSLSRLAVIGRCFFCCFKFKPLIPEVCLPQGKL